MTNGTLAPLRLYFYTEYTHILTLTSQLRIFLLSTSYLKKREPLRKPQKFTPVLIFNDAIDFAYCFGRSPRSFLFAYFLFLQRESMVRVRRIFPCIVSALRGRL